MASHLPATVKTAMSAAMGKVLAFMLTIMIFAAIGRIVGEIYFPKSKEIIKLCYVVGTILGILIANKFVM